MRRYVSAEPVNRWLQKYHRTSILAATGVAIATPLCSCGGGIAVSLSMIAVSIPWGPLVAFITASPLTSPDELFYSAGLFGWPFALTYLAAAAAAGIAAGFLAHSLEKKGWLANQARHLPQPVSADCQSSCSSSTCCSQEVAKLETCVVPEERFRGAGYLTEMAFLLVGAGTSIGVVAGMLTIVRWRVAALVTVTLWMTAVV